MTQNSFSSLSKEELISTYERGAADLRAAMEGMTSQELRTRIAPGKWSTLEVICHITDFEVLNAERIRRILAENEPTIFNGEPDDFERALAYDSRDLDEELTLIAVLRSQIARILRSLPEEAWQRGGIHSTDGPLTLRQLIERVTKHIPHHATFIAAKRAALKVQK